MIVVWGGLAMWAGAGLAVLVWGVCAARRPVGQGAPRWVPNAPDPMFRDDGLIEDDEVAELDALWDLPALDPRHTW